MRSALAFTAAILFILACGGGGASPDEEVGTEASLHQRAERYAKAFSDGNWRDAYQLTSSRFREICASGNYAVLMGAGLKTMKGTIGLPSDESIEFHLARVTAEGAFGRAYVELRNQGQSIDQGAGEKGDRWVFADGEWWAEAINWYDGCQWPSF